MYETRRASESKVGMSWCQQLQETYPGNALPGFYCKEWNSGWTDISSDVSRFFPPMNENNRCRWIINLERCCIIQACVIWVLHRLTTYLLVNTQFFVFLVSDAQTTIGLTLNNNFWFFALCELPIILVWLTEPCFHCVLSQTELIMLILREESTDTF